MKRYSSKREFYKGDDWDACKQQVLAERMRGEEVRCELCGELVTKSFNPNAKNNSGARVFHHVIPLTDINVNDAAIAINPANIQILHWQCHNKVHKRFEGQVSRLDQKVYLITGAPCSGKTTYARERMSAGDIILDIDDIWQQITGLPRYEKPSQAKPLVFAAFKTYKEKIYQRSGTWYQAFVIESLPLKMDREREARELNADEVVVMDATEAECKERLAVNPCGRDATEYTGYIEKYYKQLVR